MIKLRIVFITLLLIAFTACSDDSSNNPNEPVPVSVLKGVWSDSTSVQDGSITRSFSLALNIDETNGNVTGSYTANHKITQSGTTRNDSGNGTIQSGTLTGYVVNIKATSWINIAGEIDDSNKNEIDAIATVNIVRPDTTMTYIYDLKLEKR